MARFKWKDKEQMDKEEQLQQMENELTIEKVKRKEAIDRFIQQEIEKYVESEDIPKEEKEQFLDAFEPFAVGKDYVAGDKIRFKGTVYEVIQSHTSQLDWLPDSVPALYKVYLQKETDDGTEVIHDWKQPVGAHDAYETGDKVKYEDSYYESLIDGNSWSPASYPQGWKLLDD